MTESGTLTDWLRLVFTPNLSARNVQRLLELYQTPDRLWGASEQQLLSEAQLPPKTVKALLATANGACDAPVRREQDFLHKNHIRVLTCNQPDFPAGLKNIPAAPYLLFCKGECLPVDQRAIAIVGTRKCDSYGMWATREFAGGLAEAGWTIISGLARGIDEVAHRAALAHGGRTWAFLASGFDRIYPPENQTLADEIVEQGAVLSEFPTMTPPARSCFPARNRLVSGASLATLVIQAPAKSGALITARLAMEQNRDVFAVPGRVNEPGSQGSHRLIQDGAKLINSLSDVLDELEILAERTGINALIPAPKVPRPKQTAPVSLERGQVDAPRRSPARSSRSVPNQPAGVASEPSPTSTPPAPREVDLNTLSDHDDRRIIKRLKHGSLHVDRLAADLDLPVWKVSERLLLLEMAGHIKRLPGMCFDLA